MKKNKETKTCEGNGKRHKCMCCSVYEHQIQEHSMTILLCSNYLNYISLVWSKEKKEFRVVNIDPKGIFSLFNN
jgi:hypothetical protein